MSVFTTVTTEQLNVWLRQYALGALISLEGIAAGIENTNYFVTTSRGRYVLTLFEKLTAAELPFYLGLMAHLADHGIPCPQPIANADNAYLGTLNGKPADIVTCVRGSDIADAGVAHCAAIGALLAEMHIAGQSYAVPMLNPRGAGWWTAAMPQVLPFLDAPAAALIKAEISYQSTQQRDALPQGLQDAHGTWVAPAPPGVERVLRGQARRVKAVRAGLRTWSFIITRVISGILLGRGLCGLVDRADLPLGQRALAALLEAFLLLVLGDVEIVLDQPDARAHEHALEVEDGRHELLILGIRTKSHHALNPGTVFNRERLLRDVWKYRHAGDTRLVNVHVQRLRSKIERDPEHPEIVVSVRGVGYKAGFPTA